jgi:hypothetical protein
MLRKDTTKQHCNNAMLNVPDNASLVVYQATLARHWLVMGLKIDSSPIDARLSKMEVAIENIACLPVAGILAVNQLMERKAATALTTNVAFAKEPKWTTVMAKNVRHVVSWAVETLVDAPKQKERKLNLGLTGFEAKKGETEKELV